MKRIATATLAVLLLLTFTISPVAAQAAQAPAPVLDLRNQLLANASSTADRIVQLAEAIPAEKYAWRPAPGVRSVSEVFMHLAMANYFLTIPLGGKMGEGLTRESEKTVTDKAQVVEWLKKSVAAVKLAIQNTPDADLTKAVKLFGRDNNVQGVMLQIVSHLHEHLGQSIAYARSVGVTPPWSQ